MYYFIVDDKRDLYGVSILLAMDKIAPPTSLFPCLAIFISKALPIITVCELQESKDFFLFGASLNT